VHVLLGTVQDQKVDFEHLRQWWEVGKAQIRMFCQQYTANSSTRARLTVQALESEIRSLELGLTATHDPVMLGKLQQKRKELSVYLNERVKGALVRSRFTTLAGMEAPSAAFFDLERSVAQHKQMVCLRLPDGQVSTDVTDMRKHAVDFYSALYTAELCDSDCAAQLLQGLPRLDSESRDEPDSHLQDLAAAVGQLNTGRSPGIDGLPSDFYKHSWDCIGGDFYEGEGAGDNNLVASTLWHRFSVLQPPAGLVQEVQRMLVTFFWSGQHWVRSAVLYLPVQEGGQGLVDIRTPFYRSMLEAWKVFSVSGTTDTPAGMWLFEEPLFFNPFLPSALLSSAVLRSRLVAAGYMKLGHLMSTGTAAVSERTGIRSGRLLNQVMAEVQRSLPADYLSFLNDPPVIAQ
ncbi:hypothetical protein NFI96_028300, partial [Prochilodus magdalenae]